MTSFQIRFCRHDWVCGGMYYFFNRSISYTTRNKIGEFGDFPRGIQVIYCACTRRIFENDLQKRLVKLTKKNNSY